MTTTGLADTWEQICLRLQGLLPEASFHTWFANAHLESQEGNALVIGAANRFVKAWLENHYLAQIAEASQPVLGFLPEVRITISREQYKKHLESAATTRADAAAPLAPVPGGVSPESLRREIAQEYQPLFEKSRHTFENFVSGGCNQFALSAARKAADAPGAFSPLVLFGGHGLGKTHLLHAICAAFARQDRSRKILCLTAEAFVQSFTGAYVEHRQQDFRLRFERCDLLAIDDFQNFAVGKKAASQKELASIFDHLTHRGKQIVLACDRVSHELTGLDPMLLSRLTSGLQVRLDPLDPHTRHALIASKGQSLPADLVHYLAARSCGSVREIEGVVKTLAAMAELSGQPVDCEQAARLLEPSAETVPTLTETTAAVAAAFNIPAAELRGKKRHGSVLEARRIAVRLARQLAGASLSEIGAHFGGRTHSTVLSILRTPAEQSSPLLVEKLKSALARLNCRRPHTDFLQEQCNLFPLSSADDDANPNVPSADRKE